MRNIKKIYRTSLAFLLASFGLYLVSSHIAHAKVSVGTGAVHGRQITITQTPAITGDGVVAEPITITTMPSTFDADNDALVSWSYQWLYNDQSVLAGVSSSLTSIPPYSPTREQVGKTVRLSLRAMADTATSFPVSSQISTPVLSNAITVQPGTLRFGYEVGGVIGGAVNENTTDARQTYVMINTNRLPTVQWSFSGADRTLFNVSPDDHPFWYYITLPAKNYEVPQDANRDNNYDLQITATNPETGATSTVIWRVLIQDVAETASSARVVDSNGAAITGNPVVGQTLHSAVTLNDGLGELRDRTDVTYQWKRFNSRAVTAPVAIPGATQPTYTLTEADQGYQFRVEANGK